MNYSRLLIVLYPNSESKGRSVDDLPLSHFRDTLCIMSKFMTDVFNTILSTCVYSDIWEKALIIVPLQKVSKPVSPSDTRPIANLAHYAKIFDRIVTTKLVDHLESNNYLSPYQSGFRKNFSTQSPMFKITDDIRRGFDNKMVTVLLLFDFKKAFDSVKHSTLLRLMRKSNCS